MANHLHNNKSKRQTNNSKESSLSLLWLICLNGVLICVALYCKI